IIAQCRTQKGADYSLSHTAYHTGSVPLLSRGILRFSGNPPRFFSFPPASTDKRRSHRAPPVSFLRAEQRRRAKVPAVPGDDHFSALSRRINSFSASTPTRTAAEVSSLIFWSRPAASRSWFHTTWKQLPQRTPRAAATTNRAADSISLAFTPSRFQASHLFSSS